MGGRRAGNAGDDGLKRWASEKEMNGNAVGNGKQAREKEIVGRRGPHVKKISVVSLDRNRHMRCRCGEKLRKLVASPANDAHE